MNCWMFPGQPMRHEYLFPEQHGEQIGTLARSVTGFNPLSCQESDVTLSEHVRLQIYGTAVSLCRARELRAVGQNPDLIIEHSMGIYPALAVCGSISEQDALAMTARVGVVLTEAFSGLRYALGCLVGLAEEPARSAAARHGVYLANYNTSRHFLLAGEHAAVMAALEACSAAGAFSVSLFECDAPLHTPDMAEAAAELRKIFDDYHYAEPAVPLLEHISQKHLAAVDIPVFLLDELLHPVWWQRSYQAARSLGCTVFSEVGAGDALKKFNRWIDSEGAP
ncbi:MAG TPA: ACP S-malonyltransferase [Desulfuromonadales bacterium]|nr:ACP S-malonyltransferase [Desulfuromonadales bacterium]